MAFWKPVRYTDKSIVNTFGEGVNTNIPSFNLQDGQLTDALNMCSDDYPAIRTRNDRETFAIPLTTTPNALGSRDEYIHILDGNTWKYWGPTSTAWSVLTTSVNSTNGKFVDFNWGGVHKTILAAGTYHYTWNGESTASTNLVSMTTDAPDTSIYAVNKGRVFGVENKTLYYSAATKTTDWTTANDAGDLPISEARSNVTAIRAFADHIIVWTENSMHELWNYKPIDFQLVTVSNEIGCVNDRSTAEVRGKLFWMDYEGIYMYTGSMPKKVSYNVEKWIKGINWTYKHLISSGSKGDKIYFAIPYESTTINRIIVYDIAKDKWFIEDGNFINFTNIQAVLYGQHSGGQIWNMDNGSKTGVDNSTAISWNFITKDYDDFAVQGNKTVKDMYLVYKGSTSASIELSYSTSVSSTSYTSLVNSTEFTYSNDETKSRKIIPLTDLQNVDWYRFKASGIGQATFHNLQKNIRVKGGTY